ncbi:MAG: DUF2071 domain-containing protein [Deltaproteobacteria bacterium]|nr:DUF2071 domain-containing protein [Deltaproteobacteria bacterium]
MGTKSAKPFLTARWQHLLMINYVVGRDLLLPYLPRGLELDDYQGQHLVSLVAFNFLQTRIKGWAIPFHFNFEEINLRFYVRRRTEDGWRRGVVFVKEIVPRAAIAWVAKKFYNENYQAYPTQHRIDLQSKNPQVTYEWFFQKQWNRLQVSPVGELKILKENSLEAFITEHYWGYSAQKNGTTVEYAVEHPPWQYWEVTEPLVKISAAALYGKDWEAPLSTQPHSALLALGSEVKVFGGKVLKSFV